MMVSGGMGWFRYFARSFDSCDDDLLFFCSLRNASNSQKTPFCDDEQPERVFLECHGVLIYI